MLAQSRSPEKPEPAPARGLPLISGFCAEEEKKKKKKKPPLETENIRLKKRQREPGWVEGEEGAGGGAMEGPAPGTEGRHGRRPLCGSTAASGSRGLSPLGTAAAIAEPGGAGTAARYPCGH